MKKIILILKKEKCLDRGVMIGGWAGSNPTSNIIDYVEIMTLGNEADFVDLFTGRYNHSSFA